jgi:hypothetical protein
MGLVAAGQQLAVEPLPGFTFGAVVDHVNLAAASSSAWDQIEQALNGFGLLIFPEQHL